MLPKHTRVHLQVNEDLYSQFTCFIIFVDQIKLFNMAKRDNYPINQIDDVLNIKQ